MRLLSFFGGGIWLEFSPLFRDGPNAYGDGSMDEAP